jgi:hypothetical protein
VDPVSRQPIFVEAHVTAPDGRQSTYRPLAGRSHMGIVAASGQQRVNQVQFFGSEFLSRDTAGSPAAKDGAGGAYFVDRQLDDEELRALPDQGVWAVEWVHVDPSKPNVRQYYRTLRRAPTIGEVRQMRFAQLTDEFKAELLERSRSGGVGYLTFGAASAQQPNVFSVATAAGGEGWTVPEGALAPTSVTVYGAGPDAAAFNDTASVARSDRQTTVSCSVQSQLDFHCDASLGVLQYAQGSRISAFDLYTRDARRLEVQRQINLYPLPQ